MNNNSKIEERIITTPFGTIYTKKWQPAQVTTDIPIVLLHDSLGCVDLWRDFPATLAKQLQRPVIAYDRLGFGKSSARKSLPTIDFIEEEARLFFPLIKAALSLNHYIAFGHSVGGAMAINIAASDKDCIAVITESAQAFVEKTTLKGISQAKVTFQQPTQITRLEKWHGIKAQWVLNAWTEIWLSPQFSHWSLMSCIEKVICPTLVLHGELDEFGSSAFPEFIAQKVNGFSDMLILKDCGHVPHKEMPQTIIDKVASFLSLKELK